MRFTLLVAVFLFDLASADTGDVIGSGDDDDSLSGSGVDDDGGGTSTHPPTTVTTTSTPAVSTLAVTTTEITPAVLTIDSAVLSDQGLVQVSLFTLPCIAGSCSSINNAENEVGGCAALMQQLKLQSIDTANYTCGLVCDAASSCRSDGIMGTGSRRRRNSDSSSSSDLTYVIVGGTADTISDSTSADIAVKDEEGNTIALRKTAPVLTASIEVEVSGDDRWAETPIAYTAVALKELVDSAQDVGVGGDGSDVAIAGPTGGAVAGITIGVLLAVAVLVVGAAFYAKSLDTTNSVQSASRRTSVAQLARRSIDRSEAYSIDKQSKQTADAQWLVTATVTNANGPAQWEPVDMDPTSKSFRTKSVTRA